VLRSRPAHRASPRRDGDGAENARKISSVLAAVDPASMQDIVALGRVHSMLQKLKRALDEARSSACSPTARSAGGDEGALGHFASFPTGPMRMAAAPGNA
jgi:predicted LPLAT superfamily acyltransferase